MVTVGASMRLHSQNRARETKEAPDLRGAAMMRGAAMKGVDSMYSGLVDEVTLTNLRLVLASRILSASRKADARIAAEEITHLIAVLPEDDGETDTAHLARVAHGTLALAVVLNR
jgi:hypothetical protein